MVAKRKKNFCKIRIDLKCSFCVLDVFLFDMAFSIHFHFILITKKQINWKKNNYQLPMKEKNINAKKFISTS